MNPLKKFLKSVRLFLNQEIIGPEKTTRLTEKEIKASRDIVLKIKNLTEKRESYIKTHCINPAFALPDANWSVEAPNEFLRIYTRLLAGEASDLKNLRALTSIFSGYNLYAATYALGLSVANLKFAKRNLEDVRKKIEQNNPPFVLEHENQIRNVPRSNLFNPPKKFGECGHLVNGVIVNHDTITYQERINILEKSGVLQYLRENQEKKGKLKILEIGGGYGALGFWFQSAFPRIQYTIIDLPESLLFSSIYLSQSCPKKKTSFGIEKSDEGFRFVPNYMSDHLNESFDLIINTLSMSEMSLFQVEHYAELMKEKWIKDSGLFFEQNHDNRSCGFIYAKEVLALKIPYHSDLNMSEKKYRNGAPSLWSFHPISVKTKC